MNSEQRKFLKDRLSAASREQVNEHADDKEPKEIRIARSAIARFERQRYDKSRALRRVVEARASKVREAILFGDATKALAALKAFERGD